MTTIQRSVNYNPRAISAHTIGRLTRLAVAAFLVLAVLLTAIDLTMGYNLAVPVAQPLPGPGAGLGL